MLENREKASNVGDKTVHRDRCVVTYHYLKDSTGTPGCVSSRRQSVSECFSKYGVPIGSHVRAPGPYFSCAQAAVG